MKINSRVGIVKILLLSFLIIKPIFAEDSTILNLTYQNNFFDADIKSATIKEIFEELKKQVVLTCEIEKEIQDQKVTINLKNIELAQMIKEILNTIGNPSYMLSYKKDKSGKYAVSGITIRKRGSTEAVQTAKRELQPGEMEIELVKAENSKALEPARYKIRAKEVDVNELLGKLSNISGKKIVADKIDRKIDFEDEYSVVILIDHIINKLRPKIYKTGRQFSEVDKKGNLIKEGYYEITRLPDVEIQKRREESEKANKEGEKLMRQGKYREAVEAFSNAVDPDYVAPTINEGKIYLLNREYSEAIRDFNCVLDIDSTNAEAWGGLSEAYEKDGKMNKAIDSMEKYLEFSKDEKKVNEVKKKLEFLKDKAMKDYFSFIQKGDVYKNMRDSSKAIIEYESAIKIKGNLSLAYLKMGELYEGNKDFVKSEEMYKKIVEIEKDNFEYYLRLAKIDVIIGNKKEAIRLMNEAIKLCPMDGTVFKIQQAIDSVREGMKNGE